MEARMLPKAGALLRSSLAVAALDRLEGQISRTPSKYESDRLLSISITRSYQEQHLKARVIQIMSS